MITQQLIGREVARLVGGLSPELREALQQDPIGVTRNTLGLQVEITTPSATSSSGCPIDGLYLHEDRRIVVASSPSAGRVHFSVLHEVGHHLVDDDDDIVQLLWDAGPDRSAAAREKLSNEIAAALLLPDSLIDSHIPEAGPHASDVISLIEASSASAEACAVAAARRLPGLGYVVLAERDGTLRFAAGSPSALPIARHTPQGERHFLARAADGHGQESGVTLTVSGGTPTDPMHADARPFGSGALGVFTDGKAPWVTLSRLPAPEFRSFDVHCPRCNDVVETYKAACRRCCEHRCEQCGWCECQTQEVAELTCRECLMSKNADLVKGGVCVDCR